MDERHTPEAPDERDGDGDRDVLDRVTSDLATITRGSRAAVMTVGRRSC